MLKTNSIGTFTKLSLAVAMLLTASACTHQQLKDEAQLSAIEDQSGEASFENPTPDLDAPATPVPSDEALSAPSTPVKQKSHHVKKAAKKKSARHHAKASSRKVSKRHKRTKTMVAGAGQIEANLPPPPPPTTGSDEALMNAAATLPVPEALPTNELTSTEDGGGHLLAIGATIAALGALAVGGLKLRKARGSRRLVFN